MVRINLIMEGASPQAVLNASAMLMNNTNDLYVDLDAPSSGIESWFSDKSTSASARGLDFSLVHDANHVFFMIQQMEAWFLKQTACIERWATDAGYCRDNEEEAISQHSLIKGKDIEGISKPSEKLSLIIKHYVVEVKSDGSRGRKVKYHKVKSAPGLLDALDVEALLPVDQQLARFKDAISQLQE